MLVRPVIPSGIAGLTHRWYAWRSAASAGCLRLVLLPKRETSPYREAGLKRIRRIIRALDPKADATMGQRERLEAFRIRRAAVLVLVLFLLIASMTSCSVHALLVRMTPNTQTTAQATHSTSAKKPAKKTAKTNQHKTAKKTKPETKQSQEEQAVAKAVSAQSAALSDDEKTAILNKAQETAQNSGKPVTQYHYCIATKGNVGSADEFGNAAFRILNDEHGWPRAGAIFDQSTDGNCDFNLVLSQASEMTSFSPSCSAEYSCRVDNNVIVNDDRWNGGTQQWLAAGGNLARYRTMVINHEVGHRLGHIDNETTCAGEGQLAPLMQEQSMHLDGCKVNEYPLDSELWIG